MRTEEARLPSTTSGGLRGCGVKGAEHRRTLSGAGRRERFTVVRVCVAPPPASTTVSWAESSSEFLRSFLALRDVRESSGRFLFRLELRRTTLLLEEGVVGRGAPRGAGEPSFGRLCPTAAPAVDNCCLRRCFGLGAAAADSASAGAGGGAGFGGAGLGGAAASVGLVGAAASRRYL